ncbi:MAG TPA: precorrin-3B C(17)-methyltransferase [SAR324 cluster bacterium]|jgi:cobalt-precorrin 5A hydrolase/precorrin-3B C17-methyltransferase|nr:precorrin-3B C(17)-methyltransferase [Deltaproteobacteria bacterium]HJM06453.1 precorrin-3B C(17)-methyltransferase [SAR324 cluster bacterium]
MPEPAVICLHSNALPLAEKVAALCQGKVHGLKGRVNGAQVDFKQTADHLRHCFRNQHPLIGICSSGILIRSLVTLLSDKHTDPPVLAVAEDASCVIPLLGGHHGANDLAKKIAKGIGASAAVTTAGDLRFGIALDQPPEGLTLANPEDAAGFMAELLAGASVRIEGVHPWLEQSRLPESPDGSLTVRLTSEKINGSSKELVYHPKTLVLGVGCERGCSAEELIELAQQVLGDFKISGATHPSWAPQCLAGIFSLDLKADEPAVHALADHYGVPVRFFSSEELEKETPRLQNPSTAVFQEVGCHGVAEAAALRAAGESGQLLVPKLKSKRATCALAESPGMLEVHELGKKQGVLSVVGTGPGSPEWRLSQTCEWLEQAEDWVGYELYLELIEDLRQGQNLHPFPMGEETGRVRHALELASQGKNVALISSGDPGIYAMATLVHEQLEQENRPSWNRIRVRVSPGISALQAAAARVGAPLGHDFCVISLSDLLTEREVILQRLDAAAKGDFVVALYNPVSSKRRELLEMARDRLLPFRSPDTPVIQARNLGRAEEQVSVLRLEELTTETLDMLTVVLIGSSKTRFYYDNNANPRVYTPRGYERKRRKQEAA